MLGPGRHRFAHINLICVLNRNTQILPQTSLRIKEAMVMRKGMSHTHGNIGAVNMQIIDIMGGAEVRLAVQQ